MVALGRSEVVDGLALELDRFTRLIGDLDDGEWRTPTRCAGWTVADVAGHVCGLIAAIAAIAAGRLHELTSPDAPERQAAERHGRSPREVAAEMEAGTPAAMGLIKSLDEEAWSAPAPAGLSGTVGFAVETLWYEVFLHGDDIRDALGRPCERGIGLRAAVLHLAQVIESEQSGDLTLELEGIGPLAVGVGGPVVRGDPLTFVLVASGRAHPIELGLSHALNIHAAPPGGAQ